MPRKSEVYTWRVSAETKASLEAAARRTNRSVARLLDELVAERLDASGQMGSAAMDHQQRRHLEAARFAGAFSGHDRCRGEMARARVRARLGAHHTRVR